MGKKRTMKKRGGLFDRFNAFKRGTKVQSYCCNNKTSSGGIIGGDNVGTDCYASSTGLCNPMQNKFRCFDSNGEPTLAEIREGRDPKGNRYQGKCQFISSIASKAVRTSAAPVKVGLSAVAFAPQIALATLSTGGRKKRRYKKTKRNTKRMRSRKSQRRR